MTIMPIGNNHKTVVGTKEGAQFSKEYALVFMETSAKTTQYVEEAFINISKD